MTGCSGSSEGKVSTFQKSLRTLIFKFLKIEKQNMETFVNNDEAGLFTSLKINDFQRRISELQRSNLDLKMMIIEKENRISKILEGKVDQTTIDEYLKNTNNVDKLNSQIRSLNSELDQAKHTIASLEVEKKNQKTVVNNLEKEISILRTKLQHYENQGNSNDSQLDDTSASLKLEISKLKQNIATQESKNAELTIEILNLQSKLDDYENGVIQNDSDVSRLKRKLSNANNELASAKQETNTLKNEISLMNLQLAEKNNKIVNKSKKIRVFQRFLQDNLNEIQSLKLKYQKRSQLMETQMNDFIRTINDKMKIIESQRERYNRSLIQVIKRQSQTSKNDFCSKINQQADIIHALLTLSAQVSNLPLNSLPDVEDLMNDDSCLQLYIGRVKAAFEMQKAANKSDNDELQLKLRNLQIDAKTHQLSAKVSHFIKNLQGTMNDMTKTLHQDHIQLIDALNPSCSDLSE